MNYDMEINSSKKKYSSYDKAIENIKKAITEYQNALNTLTPIKGVASCDTLRKNIRAKIEELNSIINDYNRKKNNLKNTIKTLQIQKEKEMNGI